MNNQVFKALADPTRREILRLLANGEMTAGQLADQFDMTKPTVSHHFAVLKEADLITSRREGQQIIYSLNTTVAQDVLTWLWDLLGSADRVRKDDKRATDSAAAASSDLQKSKGRAT